MIKRAEGVIGGVVFVFAVVMMVVASFWLAPVEQAKAWGDDCDIYSLNGIAACGCPIVLNGINYNQGPSYYQNSTSTNAASGVLVAVRKGNNKDDKYGTYEETVWGKPGDTILFANCYFPGIQRMNTSQIATVAHTDHKTVLSSSDINGIPEGGTIWFNNSITNDRLIDLSRGELSRHLTWENGKFGGKILDDAHYDWAPNFSRVENLSGYVGGMGIGGQETMVGRDGVMNTVNGWTVNEDFCFGDNCEYPVSWHVGTYSEKSWLPYETHATLRQVEGENHTWPCRYEYSVPVQCNTGYCIGWSGSIGHGECNGTYVGQNSGNCGHCGGQWHWHGGCSDPRTKNYTCAHQQAWWEFKKDNDVGVKESSATLIIPYNYQLSGEVGDVYAEMPTGEGGSSRVSEKLPFVYAGETAVVSNSKVLVQGRANSLTGADESHPYATDIPYLKAQLVTFVADDAEGKNGTEPRYSQEVVNDRGNNGLTLTLPEWHPSQFSTVNVDDVDAGKYFCVAIRYYPTSSGPEGNINDKEGSREWGTSAPKCVRIAKKPSAQVWGGSLYSAGTVKMAQINKNNLKDVPTRPYSMNDSVGTSVYGSWVDQSVYGVSGVEGLASGASSMKGVFVSKNDNNSSNVFCDRLVPLSFANRGGTSAYPVCPNQKTGYMRQGNETDRKATISKMTDGYNTQTVSASFVNIKDGSHYKILKVDDKEVRYSYKKESFNLVGGTMDIGVTHVVRSDDTIKITDNLVYQDQGISYVVSDQIPKLIIYAKNIIIGCDVDRVDAVLFADENIDTCDESDVNSPKRSRQLKINGSIVSNTLQLHRTYGAVAGENSKIPAEIIDYDTSLILWAAMETAASDSSTMNITYQHELAPRY